MNYKHFKQSLKGRVKAVVDIVTSFSCTLEVHLLTYLQHTCTNVHIFINLFKTLPAHTRCLQLQSTKFPTNFQETY